MSRVAEQTLNYTIRFANALFADTAEFWKNIQKMQKNMKSSKACMRHMPINQMMFIWSL